MYSMALNENLVQIYLENCLVLVLKMLFMSVYTTFERIRNLSFENIEDAIPLQVDVKIDDDIERVKRSHLNDLQNIPIFFFVAFIYIFTEPDESFTRKLFKVYTISRIVYSLVYAVFVLPQPARLLSYTISFLINFYLTIKCIQYFVFK